jgi:DNA-binding transcriptional LysR family regulator
VTHIITGVNLSALDLNLLLVLDAVLSERSVVRAARRLHVTPPAISNALSRLRFALKDPIVTRSGRGIVPTPRALKLGPAIARALRDIDTAIHGEAFDPKTAELTLTLATADAGQIARLPGLASLVTAALPRARLRVVSVDTMVALGGLGGTEVDAAVGAGESAPGIHRVPVYEEHSVLIARRGHPRLRARAGKRELVNERYVDVHVAFGKPSRAVVQSFTRLGVTRDIAVVVPTFTAAAAVVARTDLVATIPASVVEVLGASLGLRVVASALRPPPLQMYLSWHQRTHADPAMVLFRELVARAAFGTHQTAAATS